MGVLAVLVGGAVYAALGRLLVFHARGPVRDAGFALLNIVGVYLLFFPLGFLTFAAVFVAYLLLAVLQYSVLRFGGSPLLAFAVPIVALIAIKSAPWALGPDLEVIGGEPLLALTTAVIGISYFAFRTSYLTVEVRNGTVPMPSLAQYLGFCFFTPTMAVGPINRYSTFRGSLENPDSDAAGPPLRAALRVLIGAVKFRFLAGIFDQLSYSGLLLDGNPHHWIDLPIAAVGYYLYLFCNFSGFCDIAIGMAGLIGLRVEENFNNPFIARNMREFWNRWHITLGMYMRDVVFTPSSKWLTRRLGVRAANHATAGAIALVFVLIGVWHMPGWHYLAFGVMHAIGVVTVHYYTITLKQRLGRDRYRAYMASATVRRLGVVVTFTYVTASHFLFANSFADMGRIFTVIGWS